MSEEDSHRHLRIPEHMLPQKPTHTSGTARGIRVDFTPELVGLTGTTHPDLIPPHMLLGLLSGSSDRATVSLARDLLLGAIHALHAQTSEEDDMPTTPVFTPGFEFAFHPEAVMDELQALPTQLQPLALSLLEDYLNSTYPPVSYISLVELLARCYDIPTDLETQTIIASALFNQQAERLPPVLKSPPNPTDWEDPWESDNAVGRACPKATHSQRSHT